MIAQNSDRHIYKLFFHHVNFQLLHVVYSGPEVRGTRPVLVTFENFKDRDEVLRKVSEQFPSKIDERAALSTS